MERFASQEFAVSPRHELDVLSAVSLLNRQLPESSASVTEHEAQITGVMLHSKFLPPTLHSSFRGLDFRKLDIMINGKTPATQSVDLSLFSRRMNQTNRIITLTEDDEDDDYLAVADSFGSQSLSSHVELPPKVERKEVALYLALQALRDRDEARDFVLNNGAQALTAAANLLTLRAEKKVIAVHAAQPVQLSPLRRAMLHTQTLTGYLVEDPFNNPSHVMHSAWLVQDHYTRTPGLAEQKLKRRTFVEYSPTDNMRPLSEIDDTQSVRVELSAPATTDPELLDKEVRYVATRRSHKILVSFVVLANQFDPRQP